MYIDEAHEMMRTLNQKSYTYYYILDAIVMQCNVWSVNTHWPWAIYRSRWNRSGLMIFSKLNLNTHKPEMSVHTSSSVQAKISILAIWDSDILHFWRSSRYAQISSKHHNWLKRTFLLYQSCSIFDNKKLYLRAEYSDKSFMHGKMAGPKCFFVTHPTAMLFRIDIVDFPPEWCAMWYREEN